MIIIIIISWIDDSCIIKLPIVFYPYTRTRTLKPNITNNDDNNKHITTSVYPAFTPAKHKMDQKSGIYRVAQLK